ncbi:MAG: hypothetical protein HC846_01745 [Blastocatellia bacterium]|nr:hypothetical protein [Blastocatellia bacterium]
MNWNSFGNTVEFKLKSISANATEVEISTNPILGTTLIDYGESVEIIDIIKKFFAAKNEDLSYKFLDGKSEIPINVKINEFNQTDFHAL